MKTLLQFLSEAVDNQSLAHHGLRISSDIRGHYGSVDVHHGNKRIARLEFDYDRNGKAWSAGNVAVDEAWRRKGIATAMYRHVEEHTGKPMVPSNAQTADSVAFWKSYDPNGERFSENDLRRHKDRLIGQEINHSRWGKGTIYSVVENQAVAKNENGGTFAVARKDLEHLLQ